MPDLGYLTKIKLGKLNLNDGTFETCRGLILLRFPVYPARILLRLKNPCGNCCWMLTLRVTIVSALTHGLEGAPVLAPVGMDSRVFCLCKQVARTNESVIDLCVKLEHVYLRSSAGP